MIVSSQVAGIPKRLLNLEFHEGHIGLGGFVSALITIYQIYQ